MGKLLEDKVGLITGGAVGIGRAAALVFAREGARVAVADILTEQGEETVRQVCQRGGEAIFIQCDVSQADQVKAMIDQTVATFGRLDCAFNNAGTEGKLAPTAVCEEDNWDRVIAVNLKGVWLCMKYEMQHMLPRKSGVIVNTSSVAGVVAERGFPAYAAAKGGVLQLTRTAAVEYGAAGIRINAICPGAILTPMMERAWNHMSIDAVAPAAPYRPFVRRIINTLLRKPRVQKAMLRFMQPMGRPGQANEVAETVAWLCSDAASFITGHGLMIDGGMTAA